MAKLDRRELLQHELRDGRVVVARRDIEPVGIWLILLGGSLPKERRKHDGDVCAHKYVRRG